MIYALIDTTCWVDLLTNRVNPEILDEINNWVVDNKLCVLIPEPLLAEWQNQKQVQIKLIRKEHEKVSANLDENAQDILAAGLQKAARKAEIIDTILTTGIKINLNQKIHARVSSHYSQKMAPFHNKNESHSDAYLYFSAIDYLKRKQIRSMSLATRNYTDFSASDSQEKLHEDLRDNAVSVDYYTGIDMMVSKLKSQLGSPARNINENDIDYIPLFDFTSSKQTPKLLDKVHLSLTHFEDEIQFIPRSLLARIQPFKVSNATQSYTYASAFQLNTNNPELILLLQSIKIGKRHSIKIDNATFSKGVKNSKRKALDIIKRLNQNLIYQVNSVAGYNEVDIQLKGLNECNCIQCEYTRLHFGKALSLLNPAPQKSLRDTLKHAYIYFQFGKFSESLKLNYHVYQNARGTKKFILSFISLYNLKKIAQYVKGYASVLEPDVEKILNTVNKTSLKSLKIMAGQQSEFIDEIVNWVADEKFYFEARTNVDDTVDKIRDHYASQLRGGYSTNSNFYNLVSDFAELDQFLEQNYLVYNTYTDFENIVDRLLEGILMTYSFDKRQSGRIDHINEYIIMKVIMFSKRETIIKYYKRLPIVGLKLKPTSRKSSTILDIANNLLGDFPNLRSLATDEKLPFFFWEKYRRIFENILLVLTLWDKKVNLSTIGQKLSVILEDESFVRRSDTKSISDFIKKKGKYISANVFNRIITVCIGNSNLHQPGIFEALSYNVTTSHQNLKIHQTEIFEIIQTKFFEICPQCKNNHKNDILFHIVPMMNSPLKKQMQNTILTQLTQEFLPDVYYKFTIHDVIEPQSFFGQFLDTLPQVASKREATQHLFDRSEVTIYKLNEALNIVFKYSLDINDERLQKFKIVSDYYQWLLDLNHFDYRRFDPLWILEYQTSYYLKKIFSNKNVISALLPYLRKTKHQYLSQLYIEYSKQ